MADTSIRLAIEDLIRKVDRLERRIGALESREQPSTISVDLAIQSGRPMITLSESGTARARIEYQPNTNSFALLTANSVGGLTERIFVDGEQNATEVGVGGAAVSGYTLYTVDKAKISNVIRVED